MLKGRIKHDECGFILDKLKTRHASWKNKLINKAGCITLAKFALNLVPTYYMQIAWLPHTICEQIDRTTRNFIWHGNNDRGIHCVGWNTITINKRRGGLGVRSARDVNTSRLGKLVWDVQQKDKLLINLISSKYIADVNFLFNQKTPGSPIWNAITKARLELHDGYRFWLGNGATSIWYIHHGVRMERLAHSSHLLIFMTYI